MISINIGILYWLSSYKQHDPHVCYLWLVVKLITSYFQYLASGIGMEEVGGGGGSPRGGGGLEFPLF